MSEPLDELYFRWLYSQVGSVRLRNPARTHWALLKQLYTKEFVWVIANDDNRLEDGRDLRLEFLQEANIQNADSEWLSLGCSMLEMLIGLARRLNFETDASVGEWFWKMMYNLNLSDYTDEAGLAGDYSEQDIDNILDELIWRTYDPDGRGGLFPLEDAEEDQRDVEIWYQQSAYVIEQDDRRAGV